MTVIPRRTMGNKCPICNRDISREPVVGDYPNLCIKCSDRERELKTKRKDGRIIPVEQKTLFEE